MEKPRFVFALFAVAILFSIVREWSAPAACARITLNLSNPHRAPIASRADLPQR